MCDFVVRMVKKLQGYKYFVFDLVFQVVEN
jgi:hypothetical protein